MKSLDELKNILCDELEEIAKKGELSHGDLDSVQKLTDTIKNIDKIGMLEENGYSHARGGDWEASGSYGRYGRRYSHDGSYGDSYADGDSYAGRRGTHYVRGHYSYADNENDMLMGRMEEMMKSNALSLDEKSALRKAMDVMRK